jgi:hypothetical protein
VSAHVFHNGMAEALGVSPEGLEEMTMRDLVCLALDRGYRIEIGHHGKGPGLTLTAEGPGAARVGGE